jgi:hypothetical protein
MGPPLLSDGDVPWIRQRPASLFLASMGPPLLSDGDTATPEGKLRNDQTLQWGRRFSATETEPPEVRARAGSSASMGPPLLSDGDMAATPQHTHQVLTLQWGRRFSATETTRRICAIKSGSYGGGFERLFRFRLQSAS